MKEIIFPFDYDKVPELIRLIQNDQDFCPKKYLPNLEN